MPAIDFLPVRRATPEIVDDIGGSESAPARDIAPALRVRSNALGFGTFRGFTRGRRRHYEPAPYDFERIIQAADTDSFIRQGLNKYRELLWKSGWDIVSDNHDAVEYLYERMGVMELAMRRPFNDLLIEAGDQLVKFANAFIVKARGDVNSYYHRSLNGFSEYGPVTGYYIVPAQTMEVARTKTNKVIGYRQNVDGRELAWGSKELPTWNPRDVIHITMDRPSGKIFGVPFLITVLDDVVALRQMEEDVQSLVHKELFPLYKYIIGTDEYPAEPEDIDHARNELEHLQSDGGIAMPHTNDLDVVGRNDNALDASDYLHKFIIRVCSGLGLAPHHLGIMEEGGNRSVTDRLDMALYDRIKSYQRTLAEQIRFSIINELLLEAGFNPFGHVEGRESDECWFRFKEIDLDSQIARENHEINKFNSNLQTMEETRQNLGLDPEVDEDRLLAFIQARVDMQRDAVANGGGSNNTPNKPNSQTPSQGGRRNTPNNRKDSGNKAQPANQHGSRNSPGVRHMMNDTIETAFDLLTEYEEQDDADV